MGCVVIFWELVRDFMGKRRHPHMGLYLPTKVVCPPLILYSISMGAAYMRGIGGKAVLFQL